MELDVIHGMLKVPLIEVSKSKIINLVNLNLIANLLSVKPVVLLITEVNMPPNKKTVSMLVLILGVELLLNSDSNNTILTEDIENSIEDDD
jgi:hypothetical protein